MSRVARSHLLIVALIVAIGPPLVAAQATGSRGSQVAIASVDHPSLVVAEKVFPLTVHLENKESQSVEVNLLAALYSTDASKTTDCGSSNDPHFKGFTHLLEPDFVIPAGANFVYPAAGDDPWLQRINQSWVGLGTGTFELCVFATAKLDPHVGITYYDYDTFHLTVRGENHPPSGSFTWTPQAPEAVQPVTFTANATDPDHDNITYHWDFGYFGVNGRATGDGRVATTRFYPENDYNVTLTLSDGFATTDIVRILHVFPEPTPPTQTSSTPAGKSPLPAPGVVAAIGVVALAAMMRRR
ncbi:MAG: PKD domain-containing protein [Thermoplasmatota archaeon]